MPISLTDPLQLPCGAILSNRMAKPAITEGLADPRGWPTPELEGIYDDWGRGGFGLLITGNIIVDGTHLERPGNVIIDRPPSPEQMDLLRSWTRTGTQMGSHMWAQLSHSGRQTPKDVNPHPLSPSAIGMGLPKMLFGSPREMVPDEIVAVIDQFAMASRVCKSAGFTGVQIHAAHGYLLSSFLSPKSNQRTDSWGGGLGNRARLLLSIVEAVRATVGPAFPISVKLNSADFQRGGFGPEDSEEVSLQLEAAGVDLLEVSGGLYESPAMVGSQGATKDVGPARKASTIAREAYFFEFARALRRRTEVPIMLTGGLRTRTGMQAALDEGIDILGVARPACIDPYCVGALLAGQIDSLESWEEHIRRNKGLLGSNSPLAIARTLNSFAAIYWFYAQLYRAGRGTPFAAKLSPLKAMLEVLGTEKGIQARRKKLLALAPVPVPKGRLAMVTRSSAPGLERRKAAVR